MTGTTAVVIDQMIVENMNCIIGMEPSVTIEVFLNMAILVQMLSDYAGKLWAGQDSALWAGASARRS